MNAPNEKLATDMKVLMADVEELVRATAAQTGDKIADVRSRLQSSVASIRPRLGELQAAAQEKARATVQCTDQYVHAHPWTSIGVAAGVGLVIGLLIGRR